MVSHTLREIIFNSEEEIPSTFATSHTYGDGGGDGDGDGDGATAAAADDNDDEVI
jgi:hypothetical protein